jgi:hypothetical protein
VKLEYDYDYEQELAAASPCERPDTRDDDGKKAIAERFKPGCFLLSRV